MNNMIDLNSVQYNIIRSKRKTIAIRITQEAAVEIRAPLRISDSEIRSIILGKKEWIENQMRARMQINERRRIFKLDYGVPALLRGKEYYIRSREGNLYGFDGECFFMPADLDGTQIKLTMIEIYKQMAKKILTEKTMDFAGKANLFPSAVGITSAKTRWGSCSGKNSINFSWCLIMASDEVIDYVVLHELAHIREHNHGRRFWKFVSALMPDYKQREEKLKKLQKVLAEQNWEI